MSPMAVHFEAEPCGGGDVEKNPSSVTTSALPTTTETQNNNLHAHPPRLSIQTEALSLQALTSVLSQLARVHTCHGCQLLDFHSSQSPPTPTTTPRRLTSGLQMTPMSADSTAPGSPRIIPIRQNSGTVTPRVRGPATTLSIPGLTSSKVSPDGKIPDRDVGSKLIILMVGMPARGKSYITKKIHRYLRWQQHKSKIFNVGNRRRIAASADSNPSPNTAASIDAPAQAAHILLNGIEPPSTAESMEQTADFFDPQNEEASQIRDQLAMSTLDEALDFLLRQGGSVAILDATNSTTERRQALYDHIKERDAKLQILFCESICEDPKILEANMQLKLRGPDYKDKDPKSSLIDFQKRVDAYQSAYVPLGKYEEERNMQHVQMTDVGRKFLQYNISGFLAMGIARYLANFNLSPRQIWITRHGVSEDNIANRIGGNSHLTEEGTHYGIALYNLVDRKRRDWEADQRKRALADFYMSNGGISPPLDLFSDLESKNFCVWTSMLHRSVETAEAFLDDDEYDVKNWESLKELDAGEFEGLTYEQIRDHHPEEFAKRKADKFNYNYPGVGGEGYLRVIGRLRELITEIERIKDHVLIIGHRSVCRVLMAYFMDLDHNDIANLDIPLGMAISIEPKPYGMEAHAYKYNSAIGDFDEIQDYDPRKQVSDDDGPECRRQADSPTETPASEPAVAQIVDLVNGLLNGTGCSCPH